MRRERLKRKNVESVIKDLTRKDIEENMFTFKKKNGAKKRKVKKSF